MFLNRISKTLSEDNIPLIPQNNSDDIPNKSHRLCQSDIHSKTLEWDVSIDDEDENHSVISNLDDYFEINNFQAIIHIIKCSIGTGILALSSALRYSGYVLGLISIFFLSIISIYSMHLLLEVIDNLRKKSLVKIHNLDYEKTVKLCFETGTEKLRKYSWMHHVLLLCLASAQIGFLTSYHIFVAENTKVLIDYYLNNEKYKLPIWAYQLIFFFILTPLLFFKTLKKLSYFCQLANVLMVLSLVIALTYCYIDPIPIQQLQPIKISDSTLLCFGIVIFSFESINILNPIENSLKDKSYMRKTFGVLNLSFAFILPVYLLVGFSGYWKFGENISSSIILSIPITPWYFMLCKPFYVVSIFLSYGLQGFIMYQIIWKKVDKRLQDGRNKKVCNRIVRISISLMTTILSVAIPHFDLFISLVGAFTGSAMTIIFPAICNSVMTYSSKSGNYWKAKLCSNIILILFGIIGCSLGTYTSIVNINRALYK